MDFLGEYLPIDLEGGCASSSKYQLVTQDRFIIFYFTLQERRVIAQQFAGFVQVINNNEV